MAFVLGVGSHLKTNAEFIDLDYQYFLGFLEIQRGNSSPERQHTSNFILHASWCKVQNMGTADPFDNRHPNDGYIKPYQKWLDDSTLFEISTGT